MFSGIELDGKGQKCLFKQFFGVLIHQLLLRKVESLDDMREIYFDISSKHVRFGLYEVALTMRLNFRKYPDDTKLRTMSGSRRPVEKYMNDSNVVRSGELEATFLNYGDTE
ncbi:hypothetical protein PanWU01x14_280820, partial [Parasponia andersonii]